MALVAKRTVMVLYSDEQDPYSHQVRIVLAEKGVNVNIQTIDSKQLPQDLIDINPYQTLPTLVDRELVLYHAPIIMEYLDERFPHPPLLPVYPVTRANSRKLLHRVENDWYSLMRIIVRNESDMIVQNARQQLLDSLLSVLPVFSNKSFFLSDEFTLVDCSLAPLLWRLPQLGIELPAHAQPIMDYLERISQRDSFQMSLTEVERELRVA